MNKLIPALLIFSFTAIADDPQVPFGDSVNETILNYNRTTPYIATSGKLEAGGVAHLKELGFRSIIDLRTAAEGTDEERQTAANEGVKYVNIPIGEAPPSEQDLDRFQRWLENSDNRPTLVHCQSANRVGTIWAMHRLREGTPLEQALLEARTIGIKAERESQVAEFAAKLSSPDQP